MTILNQYDSANPDSRTGLNIYTGIYEGVVRENKDALYMGRLAVYIPEVGGNIDDPKSWVTVRYASPFYGITPYRDNAFNPTPLQTAQEAQAAGSISPSQFRQVEGSSLAGTVDNLVNNGQRQGQGEGAVGSQGQEVITSYGMWAVPPDLGVTVLVMFIGGNLNRGFWFACVPTVAHGMVPAIGAPDGKTPMAEFNPIDPQVPVTKDLTSIQRQPYQPLVDSLTAQGLQEDPLRGPITSSSFREAPSNVFGISSKGGHTFVMDDGSQEGTSKLIRLRTSGGNQITMHDDTGMIYLINAQGTGWIELSPSGQIDVFGAAGINMATNGDINMHADKNVNIHAGNCVKITGMVGTKVMGGEELQLHGKKTMIEGVDSLHVHSCTEMMFTSFGDIHMKAFNYFCLKGKCFYWNSCTAKEAEQVPPEAIQEISGYQTTVARAPSKEPYKEHDSGQGGAGGVAGADSPASGATTGTMTGTGSDVARESIGGSGQPFNFNGNQQQAFDTIYAAAVKAGSADPRMTASVAMLESGYLGSSMTKRANNPFGQTIVQSQIGKNGIVGGTYGADGQLHAVYDSVDSAVADHVRRWGSSYVPNNPQQTTSNLVSKGYNTVNPSWSGSVNTIYSSGKYSNNVVSVNGEGTSSSPVPIPKARPADLNTTAKTPGTSVAEGTATGSKAVTPTKATVNANTAAPTNINVPYYNGGGGGTSFKSTPPKPIVLQNAVKTTSVPRTTGHSTTAITSTYIPGTSKAPGQVTVSTYETTPGVRSPSIFTGTQTISASSPAANPYLGRGGAQPIGADPALSRVTPATNTTVQPTQATLANISTGSQGAGSLGTSVSGSTAPLDPAASGREGRTESELANPDQNQLGETPAQEASSALEQAGGQAPSSDLPAAPGGGNTGCFATGDNCDRPIDETGGGGGGNAQGGQKNFVPPESLKNDPEFQKKLAEMKAKYPGLTDQQIYNVIGGESGFNFAAVNGSSGATGGFQFIPSTASSLGYSTAQIQAMSPAQQLAVYDKYLASNGYRGGKLGIMQAAPAFASRPGNTIVYPRGTAAWNQNPGWRGSDGNITVDSINRYYGY
jgi:hypothetical protein